MRASKLYECLSSYHRAQVVRVKGLVGKVPEVVARKSGVTSPRTCTKYLGEREILPI